jgi:Holliday junction resolvase RusA-like endonuclease
MTELAHVTRSDTGVTMWVPVPPKPTPRPKVSKFGAYYPGAYKLYVKALLAAIPTAAETYTGHILLEIEAVCSPLKASKFTTPMGDFDNLAKGICDVITERMYWKDDRQIVDAHIVKRFPRPAESPGFLVNILELDT